MSKSAVVTARLEADTLADLDAMAAAQDRSRAWIVAKAVGLYVAEWKAERVFIQEGIDAADRGELIPHEQVMREFYAMRDSRTAAAAE